MSFQIGGCLRYHHQNHTYRSTRVVAGANQFKVLQGYSGICINFLFSRGFYSSQLIPVHQAHLYFLGGKHPPMQLALTSFAFVFTYPNKSSLFFDERIYSSFKKKHTAHCINQVRRKKKKHIKTSAARQEVHLRHQLCACAKFDYFNVLLMIESSLVEPTAEMLQLSLGTRAVGRARQILSRCASPEQSVLVRPRVKCIFITRCGAVVHYRLI